MVAAVAFPLVKLGLLAVRQIAKPLANWIKTRAKRSFFFRTYVCMPPAQMYNWMEVNVKMRMLNLGKPSEVPKLNEAMAIDLGAELLGEAVIFFVAAASIIAEYIRSSLKEKDKKVAKEQHFTNLESKINYLKFTVDRQEAEIRHLTRVYYVLEQNHLKNKQTKNKPSNHASNSGVESDKNTGVLQQAIDYAVISITGKR
ncbi:putative OPA3-like protein CG13603 [Limulus polyphemus]|uniref:OPA3-like protein CG13603 n=1 Tax=Limulus polyphemus TaxID=6850 RepID=A0ABM1B5G9_LIMPO|nr:putative OPA3-like protein CG13603 [Limulus polyphemus]